MLRELESVVFWVLKSEKPRWYTFYFLAYFFLLENGALVSSCMVQFEAKSLVVHFVLLEILIELTLIAIGYKS